MKENDVAVILRAVRFSADKHRLQRRKGKDASPYINHPLEVADLLANAGDVQDVAVLVAAILHDTVEDTGTAFEELESAFGHEVRVLVEELTDDKNLPKPQRKLLQIEHARHISSRAKQIKIADKISNVRDVAHNPPRDWPMQRRREYVDWAEKVVAGCRGSNRALEKLFDDTAREARALLAAT